ncbi:MAG: response regulator transcription factor [Candidatus Zixiibacteriota bacterium]|nr:MAG: response regulator transcription factor [candidate division Zixibacteria bacterium]
MKSILVIEDDVSILRGLKDNLEFEGYEVLTAADGQEGIVLALEKSPDLILLDIMLPGPSGYDICRRVKEQKPDLPIIMLTARSKEVDKIAGLDLGADDYVTKPFSTPELLARIRAALRRTRAETSIAETYSFGNVVMDFKQYRTLVNNEEVHLSAREYEIMKFFIEHAGDVVPRSVLLDEVWGYESYPTTRTVDNHILDLRKKLEDEPARPTHILSIRGVGYKFVP